MAVDFHTHSNISDGTLSVPELISLAQARGLTALALTDHDTVLGVQTAIESAKNTSVSLIPGIELSAENSGDLHIVGLGIDHRSPVFSRLTQQLLWARWNRNEKILHKLKGLGVQISMPEQNGQTPPFVSRSLIARQMVDMGLCLSVNDAFAQYLSQGARAFVEREHLSAEECIEIIHKAGGIAIVAHVNTVNTDDYGSLDRFAEAMRSAGMDGLECYYYDYTQGFTDQCLQLADKYGFFISAGSDFHGTNKHSALGRTKLGEIPDYLYENLVLKLNKRSDRV